MTNATPQPDTSGPHIPAPQTPSPVPTALDLRNALVASLPATDPHLNLIRRMHAGVTIENFLQFFQCEAGTFYTAGHNFISSSLAKDSQVSPVAVLNRVADFLLSQSGGRLPLLKTLSSLNLPRHERLESALLSLCHRGEKKDSEFAAHAAQVIAFRYRQLIPIVLDNLTDGARDGLCFSRDPSVVKRVLKGWPLKADAPVPVRLGVLVEPQSIAHLLRSDPAVGYHLARSFGYLDDAADEPDAETLLGLCELFEQGLMVAAPCMLDESPNELRLREGTLIRALLPWEMGMGTAPPSDFDLQCEVDLMLLFSAVRNCERANFDVRMDENPHTLRGQENMKWTEFARAPLSHLRRSLVFTPTAEFKKLGCPEEFLTQYLFENALCLLERDVKQQVEQKLFLSSRWELVAKTGQAPRAVLKFPLVEPEDGIELTDLVLPRRPKVLPRLREPLSQGGESARKLLAFTQKPELIDVLRRVEQHARTGLPSVGIEIQCPIRAPDGSNDPQDEILKALRRTSLPWKQALRTFGIASPRRLEYSDLVEASFKPALSYHAHAAGILILRELNFFRPGTDLALHVSLGGDLGPDVRYILFAQQFIMPPTNQPVGQKLLSKGFANLHSDSRDVFLDEPNKSQPKHTELRSMRITIGNLLHNPVPDCLNDIATFQLLGGALASTRSDLQRVWAEFKSAIDERVAALPEPFREFLDANWYESSGDSSDRTLIPHLAIVGKRNTVRTWIQKQNAAEELRADFRQIRDTHARAAFDVLPEDSVYREFPQYFAQGAGGIPILNPDALKRSL